MANPNQSTEDFQVNGQSLMTYAYNVWTLLGRERFPPRVGDNVRIPYRNGRVWTPKTFDQNLITLGMWVKGTDVNGAIPGGFPTLALAQRAQMNSNLRALKRIFAPVRAQLSLQRTLQYVTGMETHTATGEVGTNDQGFQEEMDLQPVTQRYGTFTVDLVLADPWWYGPIQTPSVPGTINNPGDVEVLGTTAGRFTLTLNGPLTNPRLTNTSVAPAVWVQYTGAIASGSSVVLDFGLFTAMQGGSSVIGNVSHAGAMQWMVLEPGNNVLTLTNAGSGSPGTGTATLSFYPPYT